MQSRLPPNRISLLVHAVRTASTSRDTGRVVVAPSRHAPTRAMLLPTSTFALYRNLLLITSNPPFSISSVIDYYFDWPRALHSAKSFNLLISLALQSASFASVRRLFNAMHAESIAPNMETCKLHVRWLVRTGKWNDAWKRVSEITRGQSKSPSNPTPLPLWLELLGSQKRGALRHWVITDRKPNMQAGLASAVSRAGYSTRSDPDHGPHPDSRLKREDNPHARQRRLMPYPYQRPYVAEPSRYRALMQVSPPLISCDQLQILPRTIYIITRMMYQVGQRTLALSTALSYLESLPSRLRRCDRRGILSLVNLHLFMATRHRKPGLKQHFAQRRILQKFLCARPDFTPSSMTLFHLLGPLRGCRRSGTLALQCLHLFEKRWGQRVKSRLVRRRVAGLALKEGRLDIVEAMIKLERRCKVFGQTIPRTVYPARRRPWRILFNQRGVENRRWRLIEDKYRRRSMPRS